MGCCAPVVGAQCRRARAARPGGGGAARARAAARPPARGGRSIALIVLLGLLQAAPLVVDEGTRSVSLDRHVDYLRDRGGERTLDALRADRGGFRPAAGAEDLSFGIIPDPVWLRLRVQSDAAVATDWILALDDPYLDRVTAHIVREEGVTTLRSGAVVPVAERVIAHRQPVFPLTLDPGEAVAVYIAVDTAGATAANATLQDKRYFHERSDRAYVLVSAYFGMLLALAAYNFLLFLGIRDPAFLLYALFAASFTVGVLALNGIGPLLVWPGLGEPGNRILPASFTLAAALTLPFTRRFLDTAVHAPRWDRFLAVATAAAAVAVLLVLLVPVSVAVAVTSMVGLCAGPILLTCGLYCAWRRVPGARIFVVAWLALILGTILISLRAFGVLPSNVFTLYGMQIGSALEMLLLSFGLAARFNELKRQKAVAQQAVFEKVREHERDLEQHVADRTRELARANRRLEKMAVEDPLTGLANRAGLSRHLREALERAQRRGGRLVVVMMDLDGFKPINDTHGHDAGDAVLREVAQRLAAVPVGHGLLSRFGGDEFLAVLEDMPDSAVAAVCQQYRAAVRTPVALDSGEVVSVDVSLGVETWDGEAATAEELLRRADRAMYRDKRDGTRLFGYSPPAPPR